jgi:hypothetical protein
MEYSFSTVDVDPNTKLETVAGNGVESEYQCRPSTGGAEI